MRVGFFVSSKFNKSGSVSDLLQSSVIPPKIKQGIHEKPHGLGTLRVSANAKGENKRKTPNSSWWLNQPAFEKYDRQPKSKDRNLTTTQMFFHQKKGATN